MKLHLRVCLFVLSILAIIASPSCAQQTVIVEDDQDLSSQRTPTAAPQSVIEKQTFTYNGQERIYFLRVPDGLDPAEPAAVILIFHGMGEKPGDMYKAGFAPVADRENIILVYPDLVSHKSTDFVQSLLQDLETKVNLDPERLYVMGFSFGGMLVYLTACEMSDVFTAYAAVGGTIMCESPHSSDRAVPIIHIHGMGDESVPYAEGGFGMPPVDETISYWAAFNECEGSPQIEIVDKVTHTIYSPCRNGAVIEIYTIAGLGHKVPTVEISSAEVIWEFFQAHTK